MIAKLSGRVDSVDDDRAVIDVGGVGYLLFCPVRTLRGLAVGAAASLLVETHVREDHIHLYGFASAAERDWFRLLLTVQGVGARSALAVLAVLTPEDLVAAVLADDAATVARADGIGPKLARRIVGELKDKVAGGAGLAAPVPAGAGARAVPDASTDAVSALVNLGYQRAEAFTAVAAARRSLGEAATVEALIRGGLKELGR